MDFYRQAINNAVEKLNTEKRKMEDRDTYGKAFLQIFNLWRQNEVLKAFVMSKRFAKVAAQLLGVEGVRLYHDQALYKEPGGGRTPWHQDQYYWPLDTDKTVTMWMPLVNITKDMGIMNFVSRTHKLGYMVPKAISDESEDYLITSSRTTTTRLLAHRRQMLATPLFTLAGPYTTRQLTNLTE